MHFRIRIFLYVKSIIISMCLISCEIYALPPIKTSVFKRKNLIFFNLENKSNKRIAFENISYRNTSCKQGKVACLRTEYYSLHSDTLVFDYTIHTGSYLVGEDSNNSEKFIFRWKVDYLDILESKAFFIRLPSKVIKKIRYVEFVYYDEENKTKSIYSRIER